MASYTDIYCPYDKFVISSPSLVVPLVVMLTHFCVTIDDKNGHHDNFVVNDHSITQGVTLSMLYYALRIITRTDLVHFFRKYNAPYVQVQLFTRNNVQYIHVNNANLTTNAWSSLRGHPTRAHSPTATDGCRLCGTTTAWDPHSVWKSCEDSTAAGVCRDGPWPRPACSPRLLCLCNAGAQQSAHGRSCRVLASDLVGDDRADDSPVSHRGETVEEVHEIPYNGIWLATVVQIIVTQPDDHEVVVSCSGNEITKITVKYNVSILACNAGSQPYISWKTNGPKRQEKR